MSIIISNPHVQPFGLLSNKANTPFINKNITWTSVSSFVYVNMFQDEHTKALMSEQLNDDPFAAMQLLKNTDDTICYEKEILNGLSIRFSQQPRLRARLYETRGKELIYDDPKILSLLNIIRNKNVIFDPLRSIEVPRKEVLAVIAGVEKKILENPYWLEDDLKYENLIQYAIQNPPDLPYADELFINVNNIVPILKLRLREKIFINNVNKFKKHLLNVYLDYLLETEYPNIEKTDYRKAKNQQIIKENDIEKYENQLYNMYIKNKINNSIISKLEFTPDKNLEELSNEKKDIDYLLKTPENENNPKVYIGAQDPFLPSFPEQVTVDNKTFNTVIHYAYFKLMQRIELDHIPPRKIDINTIPLNELQEMYDYEKNVWMFEKLKLNNEIATSAKFDQNKILFHLLKETLNSELIWNDKSDSILGSYNNRGENMSGRFLQHIRDQNNLNILDKKFSLENVWYDNWLMFKCQDYINTIKLFTSTPTVDDLKLIYEADYKVLPLNNTSSLSKREIQKMKTAGLTIEYINLVFPLIIVSRSWMKNMSEKQVINKWMKDNRKLNEKPNLKLAKTKLKFIYNQINDRIKCDEITFIATILAGKPSDDLNQAKWQRIKYWSK